MIAASFSLETREITQLKPLTPLTAECFWARLQPEQPSLRAPAPSWRHHEAKTTDAKFS